MDPMRPRNSGSSSRNPPFVSDADVNAALLANRLNSSQDDSRLGMDFTSANRAALTNQALLSLSNPNEGQFQRRLSSTRALLNLPSSNDDFLGLSRTMLSLPTASEQRVSNHAALLNLSNINEQAITSNRALLQHLSNSIGDTVQSNDYQIHSAVAGSSFGANTVTGSSSAPDADAICGMPNQARANHIDRLRRLQDFPSSADMLNAQTQSQVTSSKPPPSDEKSSAAPCESKLPSRRGRFLVFIKILFKCLEKTNNNKLKVQAKAIVSECTRRNRIGDPNFTPLQEAVEERLRGMVGEAHWNKAMQCTEYYMTKKRHQPSLKTPV